MKKNTLIRLTEGDIHNIINETVNHVLVERFEDDYNTARDNYSKRGGMWGMEMKNPEGEWQYGEVEYDPNTQTMSCMGVSINVDPSFSVDENLQALEEELRNNGFTDGGDEEGEI
jgi:hypothetical protein